MEDMISQASFSGVFVCNVIVLQIELAFAFSWKNVSMNITSCEHEDVRLTWEYELNPGEYIKAKTWFTGENKTAKRIAHWKDTDGLKIEPAYTNRVTLVGNSNDSLLLRHVKTTDEGMYTLIPSFPLSSEPDPRLALNLTIYVSPLREEGCCKPDISVSHGELRAFLHSEQGCGKPSPILTWKVSRNKTVTNDTLILGNNDKDGMYKVCVMGPAVDRCFNGDKETLCKSHIVLQEQPPQRVEVKTQFPVEAGIGISVAILVTIAAVVMAFYFRKRFQKSRELVEVITGLEKNVRERIPLLKDVLHVNFLTKELVHIYKEQSQFQKADSDLKLQTKIYDGSTGKSDVDDINIYRNVFEKNREPLKRILIQGEVGCGKKTWCNTLTHEWCKAHAPDNRNLNDNMKFLQGYELLFNISLSKVKKFEDVNDVNKLLRYLHISMFDQLQIDIYEHVKKHNIIIIIQGLDEYTGDPSDIKNILSDKGLERAIVIITSTPTLWSRKYQETSVDRIIHVKGLDKDEMIKRARKILKDDGFPQTVIDEFFRSIALNGLEEFTTEPVFFPFLVEMWKMNSILPCTRSEFLLDVLENQVKGKICSLPSSADDYRFDFKNNIVLRRKQFIIHCGKIVTFLGEIAVRVLSDNKEGIMFSMQDFDDIFKKHNFAAEDSCQFIKDFCVGTNLVYTESNEKGVIHTFSFRHNVMMTFLAAIYISTLTEEERKPYITEFQSVKDFVQLLIYVSNEAED